MMSYCFKLLQSNAPLTFTPVPSNHFKLNWELIDSLGRQKCLYKVWTRPSGCAVVHFRHAIGKYAWVFLMLQQVGARGDTSLAFLNSVNYVQSRNLCRKKAHLQAFVWNFHIVLQKQNQTLVQVKSEHLQPAWPASSHLKEHLLPNFDSKACKQRLNLPVVWFSPPPPPPNRCPHRPHVQTASRLGHNHTDYCNQEPPTGPLPFSSVWRELGSFHQRPSSAIMC